MSNITVILAMVTLVVTVVGVVITLGIAFIVAKFKLTGWLAEISSEISTMNDEIKSEHSPIRKGLIKLNRDIDSLWRKREGIKGGFKAMKSLFPIKK